MIDKPVMFEPYEAAPGIDVLPSYFPIPGLGIIPVNAFVLRAAEPVLVDTGLVPLSDEFLQKLASVIDPADLRWLWLTHTDQDHIGSLFRVMEMAPRLRVITTYLAIGKMSLFRPLPLDRIYLLNPGQGIEVGDRRLTAIKPPSYDAPETTGFFDPRSDAFFCADCFGAVMTEPVQNAADMGLSELKDGMLTWGTLDAPWLHTVNRPMFEGGLESLRDLAPKVVLSSHLPPALRMADRLLEHLASVPSARPFVGPDQQAFEAMLRRQ